MKGWGYLVEVDLAGEHRVALGLGESAEVHLGAFNRRATKAHLLVEEVEHRLVVAAEGDVADVEAARLAGDAGPDHRHRRLDGGAGDLAGR